MGRWSFDLVSSEILPFLLITYCFPLNTWLQKISPIHCSPLPSPNTLVFQPVPICCYFLLLIHFSSSILLQPCLTAWSNIYACRTYRNNDDMHLLGHFLSLSSCGADSNWMLDGWGGRKYHFGCTNPQLHLSGQSPPQVNCYIILKSNQHCSAISFLNSFGENSALFSF